MPTHPYFCLLGATDPEMRRIEALLEQLGIPFAIATYGGVRVHPGNAYQADPMDVLPDLQIIYVECEPRILPEGRTFIRIDHHRPGDPGYDLMPDMFWHAASLGQLWKLFSADVTPLPDDLILAALDHCPGAALRGECSSVAPDAVLERKLIEIASATNTSLEEVRTRIAQRSVGLLEAPILYFHDQPVIDLRAEYLGEGYNLDLLVTKTAALAGGHAVLLRHRDHLGGLEKWSLSGHASPRLIEDFLAWAISQGLVDIYGVPSRGYAGGYVPEL